MKNKILKFLVPICFASILCGCGHSIVRTDRGTGLHLRVPNPFQQGDSFVDFKLGNIDTTMAVIRGNTTFDSNSAKGGSFTGVGGISERFALSTNPQLNEGYVAEVLTSPNVSNEAKIEIAKYLSNSKSPKVSDSKSVTIGAASGSGNNISEISPEKTGLDNLIDKTSDTVIKTAPVVTQTTEKIITNISDNTSDVVKHTVDVTGETTSDITSIISNHILLSIIIAIIFIIILIFIIEWIVKKYKHKKNDLEIINNESLKEETSEE